MTKEVKIENTNASKLSIQLLTNKNELDQVVVVGYGTRRKSDITGSIVSISEQSIKDIPSSNLASALQGQGQVLIYREVERTANPALHRIY